MSCLAVAAVLVVSGFSLVRERANFREELEQQAKLLLDTLSVASRDALYFNQFEDASQIVNNLGQDFQNEQSIVMARLYQTDGRILADAFAADQQIFNLEPDPFGQALLADDALITDWESQRLIVGKSIIVGDETVGAMSVGLSTRPLQAKLQKTLLEGLLAALLAAIGSFLLAQFISRSITKPLKQLTTATQQITAGEWGQAIALDTNDELTTLANAFNQMQGQLHELVASLQQQTQELEQSRGLAHSRATELEQTLQELHQTQEQLIQQEKMSSLGQMIAGIAHEINTPVTFIHGNLAPANAYIEDLLSLIDLYQKSYPEPSHEIAAEHQAIDLPFIKKDIVKILFSMRIGAERIAGIVKSLRTFSRLDESLCKAVNLHDCVDSTLMILAHRLKATDRRPEIEVIKSYSELPLIECYAGQLNQVFMNVLTNAIEALEDKAANRDCEAQKETPLQIRIYTKMSSAHQVLVQIGDNAGGMPAAVQSKIFDPFYTTKPIGKGTGLGLSISYKIIANLHGGQFTCQSMPGQGTDFFIQIPIHQAANT
ncbi:MAG: ATP-binding protein [Cyanobacteria bacterium P01_H01_bin.162]